MRTHAPVFLMMPRLRVTVVGILFRKEKAHGTMKVPDVYSTLLSVMFRVGLMSAFGNRTDRALVVDGASGLRDLLEVRYGLYGAIAGVHVYTVRMIVCDMDAIGYILESVLARLQDVCKEFNLTMQSVLDGDVSFGFTAYHFVDQTSVAVLWGGHDVIFRVVVQHTRYNTTEIVLPQLETSVTVDNIVPVYNIQYHLYSILSILVNKEPGAWDKLWPGAVADGITVCRVIHEETDDDDASVSAIEKVLQDLLVAKKGTFPHKLRRRIMPLYTDIAARVSV